MTKSEWSSQFSCQICASAPALRPLIKAISPRLLGSSRHEYEYSHQRLNNPKPWPPSSNQSANPHIRMGSNDSITKDVGMFGRRGSTNESGIVRTVELQTFYEDRTDGVYGRRPATAKSAPPKPLMEARNAYGRGVMKPSRSYIIDRRQDSFSASRNLEELYNDDEAPFALERRV